MTRTEPERLGWEHSGVQPNEARAAQWWALRSRASADAVLIQDARWLAMLQVEQRWCVWTRQHGGHRPSPDWGLP